MKVFTTLLRTELKLSLRGMDMIIFAICLPVIVMVILGIVYGNNPENLAEQSLILCKPQIWLQNDNII